MSTIDELARGRRIGAIVAAVARQALTDWKARRIALIDDGSPEAELAGRWLGEALANGALLRVRPDADALESVLRIVGASPVRDAEVEARRVFARLVPDSLAALPANKTALLLGGPLPPEPLLPLGDLYASEVQSLVGGWSAPAPVRALAEGAGGIDALDRALHSWFDGRDPSALDRLPAAVRQDVRSALARGTASRAGLRIVPKLGDRTLGLDLFE